MKEKISGYTIAGFIFSLLFFVLGMINLFMNIRFTIPDQIILSSIFTILGIAGLAFDIAGFIDVRRNQLKGATFSTIGIILFIIPIVIISLGIIAITISR